MYTCTMCGKQMSEQDVATYRNRCENCWTYDPKTMQSAARCYSNRAYGESGKRLDRKVVHKDNYS